MAATSTSKSSADLGADKHDTEPGFHGHAPYVSREDLENRLAAAAGRAVTSVQGDLPAPDPAQQ